MRGHRSRAAASALTLLLLGAVGASSFGHGPTRQALSDGGAWGTRDTGTIAATEAGDALSPPRGFGGPLVDERSESGEGGGARPSAPSAAARRLATRHSGPDRPRPVRVASGGARLLGLPAAPANAPPRS